VLAATFFAIGSANAQSAAPAGATGLCKDGTYTTAASKSGACRGHQGIKQWLAPTSAAPAASASSAKAASSASTAPSAPAAAAPVTPAAPAATTSSAAKTASSHHTNIATTAAPGGGAGMVWLNTESNVYHCSGSQYYGKTKQGSYLSESDAKAKRAHADHNHPCTK
ncbi:MAG TPA: DUF3761 domain-containing protein, partial [Edaphobacter sp.]|nr:DUF3761 domain-containing protein [Edaphobacter sp.]